MRVLFSIAYMLNILINVIYRFVKSFTKSKIYCTHLFKNELLVHFNCTPQFQ